MSLGIESLVEVRIAEEEDFLKIKETLTRIGVASRKDQKLYQSCHILHKQGRYYIVHFKELFALDGKPTNWSDEDKGRRNTIVQLLEEWGLIKVIDQNMIKEPKAPMSQIKIIPHKDKASWILEAKYNIGRKRK
jgi:hypothetical protein